MVKRRKFLITGAAGFIGSQLMNRLRDRGHPVIGLDNYNDHLYSPTLKKDRVNYFDIDVRYVDLRNMYHLEEFLVRHQPTDIIHLAAHAGVRDSFGKEKQYHANNIDATQNLIIYVRSICLVYGSYMHQLRVSLRDLNYHGLKVKKQVNS